MSNFEQFKDIFDSRYSNMREFIEEESENSLPFGGVFISNEDVGGNDSYGNEDTELGRIYFFKDFNIHILFYGTRCSYDGTEWDGYKEVKKVNKTIQVWE